MTTKPSEKAFLTETTMKEEKKDLVILEQVKQKAHLDGINCVTFIKDLEMIATCSFDCHVYIWNRTL